MKEKKLVKEFTPKDQKEWRNWLRLHHAKEDAVWLIYYKKSSPLYSLSWQEAVDEALCFGWIDSIRKSLDAERFIQYFSRRKPKGMWSAINKERVEQLIKQKKMAKAGQDAINTARENGSWNILNDVDSLTIPSDLEKAIRKHPGLIEIFHSLSKSNKRIHLSSLLLAKREETRLKRIQQIVDDCIHRSQYLKK